MKLKCLFFIFCCLYQQISTADAAPSNASNSTSIEDDNATKTEIKKCTRISNGQEDRETRFHVDIDSFNDCFGERRQGAGSLISDKHVLTAANVIEGFTIFNLGFGSSDYKNLVHVISREAVMHPEYHSTFGGGDLGIIFLDIPIQLSDHINIVPLPEFGYEGPSEQAAIRITGFHEETLQMGNHTVIADDTCKSDVYYPRVFCAAGPSEMCNADYGSAATTIIKGKRVLVGIALQPSESSGSYEPAAYLRVTAYRDWISEITGV